VSEDQQAPTVGPTVGKGRPTPKRRERELRRGGPVAPPPATRREAARRAKAKQAADRAAGRATGGSSRGERPLLKRDQGPVRAHVRDLVDARRNPAILIMPVFVIVVLTVAVQDPGFAHLLQTVYLLGLIIVVLDFWTLGRLVTRSVQEHYPDEPIKGLRFYAIQRATQFRRFRYPKPVVPAPPLWRRRKPSS
jgi:hypothetical protein